MTFKSVTSIINFYIPTTCMVFLYVKIFLAIKQRSNDITKFGAYTSSGGPSASASTKRAAVKAAEADAAEKIYEDFQSDTNVKRCKERSLDHKSSGRSNTSSKLNAKVLMCNGSKPEANGGIEFHRLAVVAFPMGEESETSVIQTTNHTVPANTTVFPRHHAKSQAVSCETMSLFDGVTVKVEYVESPIVSNGLSKVQSSNSDESRTYLRDMQLMRHPTCDVSIPLRQPLSANYRESKSFSDMDKKFDQDRHSNHLHCYRSTKKLLTSSSTNLWAQDSTNGQVIRPHPSRNRRQSNSFTARSTLLPCKKFMKSSRSHFTSLIHRRNACTGISTPFAPSCRGPNRANPNTVLIKEKKAAMQLGVIVGAFILCWLPYFTLFMVVAYCGKNSDSSQNCVNHTVFTSTIWFGYFNSTLNPILYPLCNANFKRAFKRMLGLSQQGAAELPPQVLGNLPMGQNITVRQMNCTTALKGKRT